MPQFQNNQLHVSFLLAFYEKIIINFDQLWLALTQSIMSNDKHRITVYTISQYWQSAWANIGRRGGGANHTGANSCDLRPRSHRACKKPNDYYSEPFKQSMIGSVICCHNTDLKTLSLYIYMYKYIVTHTSYTFVHFVIGRCWRNSLHAHFPFSIKICLSRFLGLKIENINNFIELNWALLETQGYFIRSFFEEI